MDPQDGPLLPAAKTGTIPAATRLAMASWKIRLPPGPPQELLTTCGRLLGSGAFPLQIGGR